MGYGGTGYATVTVDIAQTDVDAIVQGITGTYGRTLTDVDNDLGNYLYYNGNTAAALLQSLLDQMGSTTSALYDIENYLSGSWYGTLYNGNRVVDYLDWINSNIGGVQNYLSGSWYGVLYDGTRAIDYLNWISSNTGSLQGYLAGWSGGPLNDIASNTSYLWNLQSYLSGSWGGPLTNIDGNTNSTAYYLSGYGYGALYDGNTAVSYLNWISGNTSNTAYNTSYLSNIDSAISTVRDYLYDSGSYQSAASILNDIRNYLQQFSFDGSGRLRVTTTG